MTEVKPYTLRYTEGDNAPWIEGAIDLDDGTPVDITGWSFLLIVRNNPMLEKVGEITNAAAGLFRFVWEPGDLIAGDWDTKVRFITDQGEQVTLVGPLLSIASEFA